MYVVNVLCYKLMLFTIEYLLAKKTVNADQSEQKRLL